MTQKIRALSVWQPWASAMAVGSKRIETRSWHTHYRGPVAIHAAKRKSDRELIHYANLWNWCGALRPLGKTMGDGKALADLLPFGSIIAIGDLVDCRPTESFTVGEIGTRRSPPGEKLDYAFGWTENQLGDFAPGRFGWVFENIRPLVEPFRYRGKQRLFLLPDRIADEIRARVQS